MNKYRSKYTTIPIFKYITITKFSQSTTKRTTKLYPLRMKYQRNRINMNNQLDRLWVISNARVMKYKLPTKNWKRKSRWVCYRFINGRQIILSAGHELSTINRKQRSHLSVSYCWRLAIGRLKQSAAVIWCINSWPYRCIIYRTLEWMIIEILEQCIYLNYKSNQTNMC